MAAKTRNRPPAAAEVLTLAEAAAFLRVSEPVAERMAADGRLPGRQAEGEWRFLRSALKLWLAGTDFARPPADRVEQERLLAVVGCLADDDSLEAMLARIERERARYPVGGGS